MLEQLKNGFVSKPINEAGDQQNDTGLKNVMSGQSGGAYVNQWNQLMKDYQSKNGVAGTYTVMIVHDGSAKKEMVNLQYQIGSDGKPVKGSIKLAPETATTTSSTTPEAVEAQLIKWSEDIKKCFATNASGEVGGDMFSDYISGWGDDDTGAAKYFEDWANLRITKPMANIKKQVDTFTDETKKSLCLENIDHITKAISSILAKMRSSTDASDTVIWKIAKIDGTFVSYNVDTDIG